MTIGKRFMLVIGLAVLATAACAPDDSAVIQTQTQDANNAFSTRVAAVHEAVLATAGAQVPTLVLTAAASSTLPASPSVPATPTALPTDIPSTVAPALASSNTAAPTQVAQSFTATAILLAATDTTAPTQAAQSFTATATTAPPTMVPTATLTASLVPLPATTTPQPTVAPSSTPTALEVASSALATPGTSLYVAADDGVLSHLTTSFTPLSQQNLGVSGDLDVDPLGNLYLVDSSGARIFVISGICAQNGGAPVTTTEIGKDAGLASPQSIDASGAPGLILVVDGSTTAPAIVAFDPSGAVAFRTTNLAGQHPWGLSYDAASDRLFVTTTEGSVLVFDGYAANGGAAAPSRVITPFDATGAQQVSADLHAAVYVPSGDALILSDVGGSAAPNDGRLLIIDHASTANGSVPVRTQIEGSNTLLGDPVDLAFDGTNLYVAENFNGFLLRYDNFLSNSGTLDLAATVIGNAPHVRSVVDVTQNSEAGSACARSSQAAATKLEPPTAQPTETLTVTATSLPSVQSPKPITATSVAPTTVPPTPAPPTPIAPTRMPPTAIPPTPVPSTPVPPTPVPPTPVPPTPVPPTPIPPTPVSPTPVPPTPVPPTPVPPTPIPPTPVPPTLVPPTPVPPTPVPPTSVPPTPVPTTSILPLPTLALPTLPLPTLPLPTLGILDQDAGRQGMGG